MLEHRAISAVVRRRGSSGHMRLKPTFATVGMRAMAATGNQIVIRKAPQPPFKQRLTKIDVKRMGHLLQERAVSRKGSFVHVVLLRR